MLRLGDTGDWVGTFEGHKGAVWGVALNAQATRAASGAADFTAKIWDAVTGEELESFQHNHIIKSVGFTKNTTHLVTGSNEKLVKIFDLNRPEASKLFWLLSGPIVTSVFFVRSHGFFRSHRRCKIRGVL